MIATLSIGRLRYARSRREEYVGLWLPEPLPDEWAPDVAETAALEASFKRIRRNPGVEVCPSTFGGRPTGLAIWARARVLEGEGSARAGRMPAQKHPVLHGLPIPLVHRPRGNETTHIELSLAEDAEEAR